MHFELNSNSSAKFLVSCALKLPKRKWREKCELEFEIRI